MWNFPNGMQDYLQPSKWCNPSHPLIYLTTSDIVSNSTTARDAAIRIFNFVRDDIPFMLESTPKAAENTLKLREGDNIQKANLHVAMLRAANIPARFRQQIVKKDIVKGIVSSDYLKEAIPADTYYHIGVECFLDGKWLNCDATFDKPLIEGGIMRNVFTPKSAPRLEWDGKKSLNPLKKWIKNEQGMIITIDSYFENYPTKWQQQENTRPEAKISKKDTIREKRIDIQQDEEEKVDFQKIVSNSNKYTQKIRNMFLHKR